MKRFQQVFNKHKNIKKLRSLQKKILKILIINLLTNLKFQIVYKKKSSFISTNPLLIGLFTRVFK